MICRQHGDEVREGQGEEEIDPLDAYLQTIDAEVQTYEEKSNVVEIIIVYGIGREERRGRSDGERGN